MPGKVKKEGNIIYLNAYDRWYQYDETQAPLGAGAMGVVYIGKNCQTNEPVAVKRVVDHYANNPEIRRRAHQEADLMFSHPNLVEMLGCCEVAPDYGPIFIISRFVKGENIDKFINEHVRSLPNAEHRICELFLPVLDALAYIHTKGIIHMDIKPSNIMMEQGRNVRLMDLGIADVSETINSSTSGMMGTPKYAAPEQFSDVENKSQLTSATDIYEAGITLYELITKQNPFSATTVAESKALHHGMILPKVQGISDSVFEVTRKATAIRPEDRYQNANAMKMALKAALPPRNYTKFDRFLKKVQDSGVPVIGDLFKR
ncbi:MAG: serine/threonine protein kinase [Prevotella sp.]|nr:serine/threonine protein kinase [Prevotella sp.]